MNDTERKMIEERARELQEQFWDHLVEDTTVRPNPYDVTNPELLAAFLGIDHLELPEIRNDFQTKSASEIGGLFDRQQNLIATSLKFPSRTRRFTLAHELAHAVLHTGQTMFRDLPVGEPTSGRPHDEQEADHFAACLLMPKGFITEQFKMRFGNIPLKITDLTGHALGLNDADMKRFLRPKDLEREVLLAESHRNIEGQQIYPLSDVFSVSTKAMAIRIRELELVRYP